MPEAIGHGSHALRGSRNVRFTAPFSGRFGRMFPGAKPFRPADDDLVALAATMVEPAHDPADSPPAGQENFNNLGVPAGFTYFGQFIDHDITFDPTSIFAQIDDPQALVDFRTPRFDLDSVYGRGPGDQPYLYDGGANTFLIGKTLDGKEDDLPRNEQGRGLVGDKRNDENLIVSQIQLTFLKFHNRVYADLADPAKGHGTFVDDDARFARAHDLVRWHYQWVLLNDFLERLVDSNTIHYIRNGARFFEYDANAGPFMPIEFSVAAYRLGHSMVRFNYHLNPATTNPELQIFGDPKDPKVGVDPDGQAADLHGFRRRPPNRQILWHDFFEVAGPKDDLQFAMLIDPGLSAGLSFLPPSVVSNPPPSLAARNLLRGKALGLPSGQEVARRLGLTPLDVVVLGKAESVPAGSGSLNYKRGLADKALTAKFGRETPLWYYILAEALQQNQGKKLGDVGARIVTEVFLALLEADSGSIFNSGRTFRPRKGEFGAPADNTYAMADLITYVHGPGQL
jgi:hypothetical protein